MVTSPGLYGFTPWLDRETGYYAILAMEIDAPAGEDVPAEFAVKLFEELLPLVHSELGR